MSWRKVTTFYGYAVATQAFGFATAASGAREGSHIIRNDSANLDSGPAAAPEAFSKAILVSGGEAVPDMVTATMSWLATDAQGNTIHVTSTYINDRADIDYEPTTTRAFVDTEPKVTDAASPQNGSSPSPDLISSPAALPTDAITNLPQTVQLTVAATQSIPAAPISSVIEPPWGNHGVPWILLSWLRGSSGQTLKHKIQKPGPNMTPEKMGQKGRVEEDAIMTNVNGTIEDAYDREQLFELYKQLVKEYGNSLMFPNINEEEMLFPMPGGEIATGTLVTTEGTAFIVGSATVSINSPAATFKGQLVSLDSKGLHVGSRFIPLGAVAPVNPTDYAAAFTLENEPPMTLLKPADNPGIMTYGSVTLSAGGAAMVTAGHSILYNNHGEVVIDNQQTIDPSPVRIIKGVATPLAGSSPDAPNAPAAAPPAGKAGNGGGGGGGGGGSALPAVTRNGIVFDGGAAAMNQAPTKTDASPGETFVTSYKTVTAGGVTKTVPVVNAKATAGLSGKKATGDAASVVGGGSSSSSVIMVMALVLGLFAL